MRENVGMDTRRVSSALLFYIVSGMKYPIVNCFDYILSWKTQNDEVSLQEDRWDRGRHPRGVPKNPP